MAWNEPDKDKNPWGNGSQRAPELDRIVRNLNRRLGGAFGGKDGGGSGPVIAFAGFILALIYVASGFYMVDAGSSAVVQRFGEFHETKGAGLRWNPPVVDQIVTVNTDKVQEYNHRSSMLTLDANIIDIDINVQYRHENPTNFVFNVRDPDESLQEVAEAAIRAVAGAYNMEDIQTTNRNDVATETLAEIQRILNIYETGIKVIKVNLNETEFPQPVQDAVQDVIKASRDQERFILEAQAYRNDILPKARGEAQRLIQDAEAYRDGIVADARGEADRFKKLLTEYEKAPEVTRQRLYLETIEQVYGDSSKVLMDSGEGSGNLLYLPVDKLINESRRAATPQTTGVQPQVNSVPNNTTSRVRENARRRSRER
ncbi:MAG: FtsH protease activity modulator HflK [Pseudomonadota bacterium]